MKRAVEAPVGCLGGVLVLGGIACIGGALLAFALWGFDLIMAMPLPERVTFVLLLGTAGVFLGWPLIRWYDRQAK